MDLIKNHLKEEDRFSKIIYYTNSPCRMEKYLSKYDGVIYTEYFKNKRSGNILIGFEINLLENDILENLLPKNIATQIYTAFLENLASEQGSRMTAMDNATRNAGDLIAKLTINYNRTRQAVITKELIEIISGAESL